MSNYMEKVAEMLGVKLGERFKINGNIFWFDGGGGLVDDDDNSYPNTMKSLLTGELSIEKIPWKPQYDDKYWCISMDGDVLYDEWDGCVYDYAMYYAGNCFETYEEAKAHAPEVIEKLRRKYEEG